jgi:hypothetical protein
MPTFSERLETTFATLVLTFRTPKTKLETLENKAILQTGRGTDPSQHQRHGMGAWATQPEGP